MGIMKEIYIEMINRNFQGTPEEFLKIYIKEMNDKQKEIEIENGKKYLHKENK